MSEDLERRAGKGRQDEHPEQEGEASDASDYADPRVAQPGETPDPDASGASVEEGAVRPA
jgi:hypothetical protein